MHSWQLRARSVVEYLPLGQSVQDGEAGFGWNLPAVHAKHTPCAESGCASPRRQSTQAVCPLAFWCLPGSQATHSIWSDLLLMRPTGQSMHAVAPVVDWYLPIAHASETHTREVLRMIDSWQATESRVKSPHRTAASGHKPCCSCPSHRARTCLGPGGPGTCRVRTACRTTDRRPSGTARSSREGYTKAI